MTPEPASLPADLADLLNATLAPDGLPGILADWLEERSIYWQPLATALRVSQPLPDTDHGFWIGFRYCPVTPDVFLWIVSTNHFSKWSGAPADGDVVIGAYRRTRGREARWTRIVPRAEVPDSLRKQLWDRFLSPA